MNRVTPGRHRGVTLHSSCKGIADLNSRKVPEKQSSPQASIELPVHVGAIWKSARDKRACIQGTIKSFNDSPPYLDLRIFELDAQGRMQATHRGITVSMARLPALAQLVGDAVRKASAAGLIMARSA